MLEVAMQAKGLAPEAPKRIINFVMIYRAQHLHGPTLREVAAHLGVVLSTAVYYIRRLESAGMIITTPGVARSLRLAEVAPDVARLGLEDLLDAYECWTVRRCTEPEADRVVQLCRQEIARRLA